jgi:cell division protein FtsI/penicillin-binding protein 2
MKIRMPKFEHLNFSRRGLPQGSLTTRMKIVGLIIMACIGHAVAQVVYYNISESPDVSELANKRISGTSTMEGTRGRILDHTGNGVLAVTVSKPSVAFYGAPYNADRGVIASTLACLLGLNADQLFARIANEETFALIKRNISDEEKAALEKLELPGVRIIYEDTRYYPLEEMGSAVIGSTLDDSGNRGIEAQYDEFLRQKALRFDVLRDQKRRGVLKHPIKDLAVDGQDIVVAIDPQIQALLHAELDAKVQSEEAIGGMGIVLDAKTFEVLAMTSIPAMDANKGQQECRDAEREGAAADDGSNPCKNKVVSFMFEPGSVGKILALIAGLESGKITLDTMVDGHMGTCQIGKFTVTDVKKVGVVPVLEAIKYSSNCAMSEVGRILGAEIMFEMFTKLGVGRRTGVDLPFEASGVIKPPSKWGIIGAQAASYGYGYAVTQIQLARIFATVANNGYMLVPKVAIEIRDSEGKITWKNPLTDSVQVFSEKTAQLVKRAMWAVVMEEGGTGSKGKPDGYTAGGKTGTARLNSKIYKKSGRQAHILSFAGFAPFDDPRIVVVISIIDPKVHRFAGEVAAPVFKAVVEGALPVLGVEKGREN